MTLNSEMLQDTSALPLVNIPGLIRIARFFGHLLKVALVSRESMTFSPLGKYPVYNLSSR